MNIPEEALTAAREAVEAWFDRVNHPALDIICDFEVDSIARAALSAAAPTLMAQAWEEGAVAMESLLINNDTCTIRNPYMKEQL